MVVSLKAFIRMAKRMDLGLIYGVMALYIPDNGLIIKLTVGANIYDWTEDNI